MISKIWLRPVLLGTGAAPDGWYRVRLAEASAWLRPRVRSRVRPVSPYLGPAAKANDWLRPEMLSDQRDF